nr:hypothetical protein [uncultured Gellertiella sp.]
MFAGRYAWWLITVSAVFLLFLLAFDGVAWITVAMSDCAVGDARCFELNNWLLGVLKPVLCALAGAVLVGCLILRILYLRFSPLWLVPVLVWAFAVAIALRDYMPLWHGGTSIHALLLLLPPSLYALLALALFLCFPLEDEDMPVQGRAAPLGVVAGFAALICCLQVVATATSLPVMLIRVAHVNELAGLVAALQKLLVTFLLLGNGTLIPGLVMVTLFALSLALRIVRHEQLTAGHA